MTGAVELMPMLTTRTLRLKVKPESHAWLEQAAREVNMVWNWANETSDKAIRRFAGAPVWLSGFDLDKLSAGACHLFDRIGSSTINAVNHQFAVKRKAAKKTRLQWRRSSGSKRSLGWVPCAAEQLRRNGKAIRFSGKTIRVFESHQIAGQRLRGGQFSQDSVGDWWLCVAVQCGVSSSVAPREVVGIDLGLKDTATTSDGDRMPAGRYFRDTERKIGQAQRRGHKRQAKRLYRKAARQRKDALHKFTTRIVGQYQKIVVGDVSSDRLVKTRMAKAVMDSGWGMLRQQLQYKGESAGRTVQVVNEAYTTRACSSCGSLSGPTGVNGLRVREWACVDCGAVHDRDVNAARNIAHLGSRHPTSVRGNKSRRKAIGHECRKSAAYELSSLLVSDDRPSHTAGEK